MNFKWFELRFSTSFRIQDRRTELILASDIMDATKQAVSIMNVNDITEINTYKLYPVPNMVEKPLRKPHLN